MKNEDLKPSCNQDTVRDGRGGFFTWVPPEPLLEVNLLHTHPGKTRGIHYQSCRWNRYLTEKVVR